MVDFYIDHLDPLGQGVSRRIISDRHGKRDSVVTFIPKTLPGERGDAEIVKRSKGVEFAVLGSLANSSPLRLQPECPHYENCPGCDYLHVSYENEVRFKSEALAFLFRNLEVTQSDIQVKQASERFFYRNRVQLHYRHKYLGLIDSTHDRVLEIPDCRLVSGNLKQAMNELYRDKSWSAQHPGRGHVELYERQDGEVSIFWDQPYAGGGFSQVNPGMNRLLRAWLADFAQREQPATLLDLFSGSGNLTELFLSLPGFRRQMVDSSPKPENLHADEYLRLDLYNDDSLQSYLKRRHFNSVDWLVLDPPRKGFSLLLEWVKKIRPKRIIYVSCEPATLARDLKGLLLEQQKLPYYLEQILLFDMFPGTRHYETVAVLGSDRS